MLPTGDGVYGVQAGHNPVLVALHMGIAKFTVDGETLSLIHILRTCPTARPAR